MKFNIEGNLDNNNGIINIYAKGSREISSKLEGTDYIKHSKYNAYIINNIKSININYMFTINGNIGDLITVSTYFCDKTGICTIGILNDDYEYSGFLKKGISDKNCYLTSLFDSCSYKSIKKDINNIVFLTEESTYISGNNYKCLKMNNVDEVEGIFYDFYISKSTKRNITNLISVNYEYSTTEDISFIPIINEYFNFLTYKIYTNHKKTKAYITTCNTYPLCNLDLNKINNFKEFERFYDSYFTTFNRSELDPNWSPINKIQHVILFK